MANDFKRYAAAVNALPQDRQAEIYKLLDQLEASTASERARTDFMAFVRKIWPDFIEGAHHKIMADTFNRIADGSLKRVIINMAPRHTKSEFASYLLPAWFLGRFPKKKVIQASNTAELAQGFGRKVRNLIQTDPGYREVFNGVKLAADSTAAGRWNTSAGGSYFALGVGAAIAGKGADLFIIDDPHSEAEALAADAGDPEVYDKVYEWYTTGPRQRLQPGGAICIVMTRWSQRDLTAQILKAAEARGELDTWEVIEFPAILPTTGKPIWPEFWSLKELEAVRRELPIHKWAAQYQQQPTSGAAALVKREWWRLWERDAPPKCEFLIQSWDTAFSTSNRADYSACTTWGVFNHPGANGRNYTQLILLDSFKDRLEFPNLKVKAAELYAKYRPDVCVIEASAAGTPLVFELRAMGIPVSEYVTARRANDKILRVNSVTDLFASGQVWYMPTPYNMMVIDEFANFPVDEHDDLVDSSTQALIRYRTGGIIRLESDEDDPDAAQKPAARRYYRVC